MSDKTLINDMLGVLPQQLRDELIGSYINIAKNYVEHRWEPSELDGGKFVESAYCVVNGYLSGQFPNKTTKPTNLVLACEQIAQIQVDPTLHLMNLESMRITIPRMLIAIYNIRNKRGVGHVDGDVNPNEMDASVIFGMAKWVLAEFIRIFHKSSVIDATTLISSIVERSLPIVWEVNNLKRVLNTKLSKKNQVLTLLYSEQSGRMTMDELSKSLDTRKDNLARTLRPMHEFALIYYDEIAKTATISPIGVQTVENEVLAS